MSSGGGALSFFAAAAFALTARTQWVSPLTSCAIGAAFLEVLPQPGLHKRTGIRATVRQVLVIAAGIGTIVLADRIVDRFAG